MRDRRQSTRIDISFLDLPGIFQNLLNNHRTGTLKVTGPGRQEVGIRFTGGNVSMFFDPADAGFLADALVRSGQIDRGRLQEAFRSTIDNARPLAPQLIEHEIVGEDQLLGGYLFYITEKVCDLFTWTDVECEFLHGDPPAAWCRGDFDRSVEVNPNALLFEATRRADEIARIRADIPTERDVPVLLRFPESLQDWTREAAVSLIDGIRDVGDILDEVPLSRFVALAVVHQLLGEGTARMYNQVELLLAARMLPSTRPHLDAAQLAEKRIRLYERAEALGGENRQIDQWLAEAYEAAGRHEEAAARLLRQASFLVDRGAHAEALEALRRAHRQAPSSLEARRGLYEAVLRRPDGAEEAAGLADGILRDLRAGGGLEEALEFARAARKRLPDSTRILEHLARLLDETGNRVPAILHYEDLAAALKARGEARRAIDLYQRIIHLDNENTVAHYQLAGTLQHLGRNAEAAERYKALADMLRSTDLAGSINWAFLIKIYEQLIEIEPENLVARKWLADTYVDRKETGKALVHYRAMVEILDEDPADDRLPECLDRVIHLDPDDLGARRRRAEVYAAREALEAALAEYLELSRRAMARGNKGIARQAISEAMKIHPNDSRVHLTLSDFHGWLGDAESAAEKLRDLGYLKRAAGHLEEAEEAFLRAVRIDERFFSCLFDLAETYRREGRAMKAERLYREFVRRAGAADCPGLARRASEAARLLEGVDVSWTAEILAPSG